VIEFGVTDLRGQLTVFHLENPDILHVGFAVEVVFLYTGGH
jgi:hypothetical protein